MESAEKVIVGFIGVVMLLVAMMFGSCSDSRNDIARYAIDRASVVRMVDDIANGGGR